MTRTDFEKLKEKFIVYTGRFIERSLDPGPLILKKDHTLRVCREMNFLAESVVLDKSECILAETMALFHDLGRFIQYEKYKTFMDSKSEDHAALSISELEKHDFLNECNDSEQQIIKDAVRCHNAAFIPSHLDDRTAFFARLLRDADKLDIWNVVIGNYISPEPGNKDAVNMGFEDDGKFSAGAMESLLNRTFVKSNTIARLNDLKLMQIGWVFDLNFAQTASQVKERDYIGRIVATMPESDELKKALNYVYQFLNDKINGWG